MSEANGSDKKCWLAGGSWDGHSVLIGAPLLQMPKKGGRRNYLAVTDAQAEDTEPLMLDIEYEMYVLTRVQGSYGPFLVYVEQEQYQEAMRLLDRADATRARAYEYAREADRGGCDESVNAIFAQWAYEAIIQANVYLAMHSELLVPKPAQDESPPDGGWSDEPTQLH